MKKLIIAGGYTALLSKVKKTLIEGQQRIEQERGRTYWETGRVIYADILKHKDRAEYGGEVLRDLADDLDVDLSLLQRCVRFAKAYPRLPISAGRPKFKWSHYRELITISDDKRRLSLEKAAAQNDWTAQELAARIKSANGGRNNPGLLALKPFDKAPGKPRLSTEAIHKPLTPLRGTLYTYRLVKRPSVNVDQTPELRVDLGFGVFHKVDSRFLSGFNEGDIVESRPKEDAYKFYKGTRSAKDLYTYAVFIEKVIDADTLKVRFDLGFNTEIRQTLRLRGIDCPEMDTKEGLPAGRQGQAAKAFVQSYIKEAQLAVVHSSRSDKYDRYLADVFIPQGEEPNPQTDIYLNNLLLEHGYAVRAE